MEMGRDESIAESIMADSWNSKPRGEDTFSKCSSNLSFDLKRTALEASASVVGILSHLDETKVFRGSGFVVESILVDGQFVSTIFTSATALRPEAHIDAVADNIKIRVILFNEITCEGYVCGYDFHYNIGVIKIQTDVPIATARLRHINDSISINPNLLDEKPPKYDPQSGKFNLVPGDAVVALGRFFVEGGRDRGLMVVAGKFSVAKAGFDCQELLMAEFDISKHGIGGPLINCDGEVIGMNFFFTYFTPFLPINIVLLWWEQFKKNGHCPLPRLQMELKNLYLEGSAYLEILIQTSPNNFEGVIIDELTPDDSPDDDDDSPDDDDSRDDDSPGDSDGLLRLDAIVKCDGKPVRSVLEFFELIWDKVGQAVVLEVLRPIDCCELDITLDVDSVGPDQFNRWPLFDTIEEARVPKHLKRWMEDKVEMWNKRARQEEDTMN